MALKLKKKKTKQNTRFVYAKTTRASLIIDTSEIRTNLSIF